MSSMPITFGTDGWRAVVGDDFTYENVRAVAQAVAWYRAGDARPIVIGHDSRYCAELFAREFAGVLAANGCSVILINRVVPTPVVSWTVVDRAAAAGIAITASHNPMEFNGIKYKPDFGGSASPEIVAELEVLAARALVEGPAMMSFDEALDSGRAELVDAMPSYLRQLDRLVDLPRLRDSGLRVLHEAMYGAGQGILATVLDGGTTTVHELHGDRNPSFGGMHPEPIDVYLTEALEVMRGGSHDLAIANDGDADRVGVIDERGQYVDQHEVMALYTMYLLEKRGLRGDIVRSVTQTRMVDTLGKLFDTTVHELPVGFKFVGQKMREVDALLGGEESGGYAFRGHIPERDGILAGLFLADMIVEYAMPLSAIVARLEELVGPHAYNRHDIRFERGGYSQRKKDVYERMTANAPVAIAGSRVVRTRSDDGFKFYLEDDSWGLLRMSGTEPLMRIYSESSTPGRVEEIIADLERHIGVNGEKG
ncbi:MAG: phosphoglucomutase/phosphomannomutase family protein [Candidatus Dormibacteria bacterium]